jgi:hypothetical protein
VPGFLKRQCGRTLRETQGFATVFLQGADEAWVQPNGPAPVPVPGLQDCGAAWNVGGTGDNTTCERMAWSEFGCACACCPPSCRALGRCTADGAGAGCGWTTCYDDVDFVQRLLAKLGAELCIDTARVFVAGESGPLRRCHLDRK